MLDGWMLWQLPGWQVQGPFRFLCCHCIVPSHSSHGNLQLVTFVVGGGGLVGLRENGF